MQSQINRYGDLEVFNDEITYSIPIEYTDFTNLAEVEENYKQKGNELHKANHYLSAHDVQLVSNRLIFTFYLEHMKAFFYLRQIYFEDQLYYFRSFVEIARNNESTRVIWDKNNFFVDLTDGNIKALVYKFEGHKLYHTPDAVHGLKEMILLSVTKLYRLMGKPRLVDFIDRRDIIVQFAEEILRAETIDSIENVLETYINNEERVEADKLERQAYLKGLGFWGRQKELKKDRVKEKRRLQRATNQTIGLVEPKRGLRSRDDLVHPDSQESKSKNEEQPEVFMGFTKKQLIIWSSVIAVSFVLYVGMTVLNNQKDRALAQSQNTEQATGSGLTAEQTADVYRLSMAGNNKEALKIMETAKYDMLGKAEQKLMLKLYEKTGQYTKAIALSPEYADTIVSNLIAAKKIEELKKIQVQNPDVLPVNYELAYRAKEYQKVIQMAGDSTMNDRKKDQLLMSYLWVGMPEQAKLLAKQEKNPAMTKKITAFTGLSKKIKAIQTKIEVAEKKKDTATAKKLKSQLAQIEAKLNKA